MEDLISIYTLLDKNFLIKKEKEKRKEEKQN